MPTVERPAMSDYGVPAELAGTLPWAWAQERLVDNRNYWVVSASASLDLISAIKIAGRPSASDADVARVQRSACPDVRVVFGHVHGQLDELPGRAHRAGRDGDRIAIDIPSRSITLDVDDATLTHRRREQGARASAAWTPTPRARPVSEALRAYAATTTSAANGAVRSLEGLRRSVVGATPPGDASSASTPQPSGAGRGPPGRAP